MPLLILVGLLFSILGILGVTGTALSIVFVSTTLGIAALAAIGNNINKVW